MAFIPAVDCALASVEGLVNSVPVSFGLNCEYTLGAYDQDAIDALAAAVDGWFSAEMFGAVAADALYLNTHVRGLTSSLDLEADNNDSAGSGTGTGGSLPNNVSWVIKHTTGFTGRSGRGRTYLWGLPQDILSANENMIIFASAEFIVTAFEALEAALFAVDWRHVVVSRFTAGAPRVTALILPVVAYSYTDLRVDTRRKRLGG